MSLFHKPRLSSAMIFAVLCVNSSFASPVANAQRSRHSVIAAYAPVHIISTNELSPELPPPRGDSSTTNDGTTLTTTYNVPRDAVQKRQALTLTSATEPVYIIPANEAPPGTILRGGSSHRVDDGTTVTTTFTPPTNYTPNHHTSRSSLELVQPKNQTLAASELSLGLNCEGSKLMCVGAAQMGVMHTLRDYMYAIPKGYRYYAGQNIACMKHYVYPWITYGFYCAFMQGNVSPHGEDGPAILLKMQQMIEHHCLGCGSVPFSPDNDPNTLGILTVNYVRVSECEGLCYYVPPGTPENAVKVPQGMDLVS